MTLLAKTNEIYTQEKEDEKNEKKNKKINVKENLMNIYVTDKECEVTDKLIVGYFRWMAMEIVSRKWKMKLNSRKSDVKWLLLRIYC